MCGYFQVSTYGLFVEDVVGVSGETVVVDEAAASRIQRLTKVNGCEKLLAVCLHCSWVMYDMCLVKACFKNMPVPFVIS